MRSASQGLAGKLWQLIVAVTGVILLGIGPTNVLGQLDPPAKSNPFKTLQGLNVSKPAGSQNFEISAETVDVVSENTVELRITAKITPGWHLYSLTQAPGGPNATIIQVDQNPDFDLISGFTPDKPPHVFSEEAAWKGLQQEIHEGAVTWAALIELKPGARLADLRIQGSVTAQTCNESGCLPPLKLKFVARFAGKVDGPGLAKGNTEATPPSPKNETENTAPKPSASSFAKYQAEFTNPMSGTTFSGELDSKRVAPGDRVNLQITLTPAEGKHSYAYSSTPPAKTGPRPTRIILGEVTGLTFGTPQPSAAPTEIPGAEEGVPELVHSGSVTWTIPITVAKDFASGEAIIEGIIGYQTCLDPIEPGEPGGACDQPRSIRFAVPLEVSDSTDRQITAVLFGDAGGYPSESETGHKTVIAPAGPKGSSRSDPDDGSLDTASSGGEGNDNDKALALITPIELNSQQLSSLPIAIVFALIGGLILNVMPCVLPVIGLKVLSFVEQAKHDRGKIFLLNVWYSAGLISVFVVLAAMAAIFGATWGSQFQSTAFNMVMCGLVFAMALSFLGVWEIPIPGFASSSSGKKAPANEGFAGAFSKGVLTTILATPCSGPFLGPVFAFTLKQPPLAIFAIFIAVGLGMALPYLLIGAVPSLIRFLPKPGDWMETFKQLMGFVLLLTAVWLFRTVGKDYQVMMFGILVGIWAGLWWVGRIPIYEDLSKRLTGWGVGTAAAVGIGLLCAILFGPQEELIKWKAYTLKSLIQHIDEKKTVFIDFTADW